MTFDWIDESIRAMNGTEIEYKAGWDSTVYKLGGKMFGMRGSYKDGRPLLTLKLPPAQNELLRESFEHIIPGYYSNKVHWSSLFLDTEFDRQFITDLLEDAYDCLFEALPKMTQSLLTE